MHTVYYAVLTDDLAPCHGWLELFSCDVVPTPNSMRLKLQITAGFDFQSGSDHWLELISVVDF